MQPPLPATRMHSKRSCLQAPHSLCQQLPAPRELQLGPAAGVSVCSHPCTTLPHACTANAHVCRHPTALASSCQHPGSCSWDQQQGWVYAATPAPPCHTHAQQTHCIIFAAGALQHIMATKQHAPLNLEGKGRGVQGVALCASLWGLALMPTSSRSHAKMMRSGCKLILFLWGAGCCGRGLFTCLNRSRGCCLARLVRKMTISMADVLLHVSLEFQCMWMALQARKSLVRPAATGLAGS